jgi:hypothetical protein
MSIYEPKDRAINICIVYMHSLNGSRLEASKHAIDVLEMGALYVTFDFSGSGKSDG